MSVDDIGAQVNQTKSMYRLLMTDLGKEEFSRETVMFAGLADLMDKFALRLAAAADIPATRFMGRSPVGLNATGDSDMDNYVMHVEAQRERMLERKIGFLDDVLLRNIGVKDAPDWSWRSLVDQADQDVALAAKTKAEAIQILVNSAVLDEDEGREAMSGDELVGDLPGPAPEPVLPSYDEMPPGIVKPPGNKPAPVFPPKGTMGKK